MLDFKQKAQKIKWAAKSIEKIIQSYMIYLPCD